MTRLLATFLVSLTFFPGLVRAEPSLLEHLQVFLTGTFSNADQARNDQNFRPATLQIARIWSDRPDGPWLYLEQSLADAPAHPYRQAIYQLALRADGTLEAKIFDLPDLLTATGAWKDPSRLAGLSPDNLTLRTGCTLVLKHQSDGSFKGGTTGRDCASELRGATYSKVEAVITNVQITMWERGYNAADVQVWGSIHGGHVFKRVE
jgi:CpeT protein